MPRSIGLVGSPSVAPDLLASVAAALNEQAQHLCSSWGIAATVSAFPTLDALPSTYWPIQLVDEAPQGAPGVHHDDNGSPYSLVQISPNWPFVASHECIEMLVDPLGNKLAPGPSPIPSQGTVQFLVEVCDPCQDPQNGYLVHGHLLSDFCTPSYFQQNAAGPFSHNDRLSVPLQLLENGCLTWFVAAENQWWQRFVSDGQPQDEQIPGPSSGMAYGLREWIHARSKAHRSYERLIHRRAHGGLSDVALDEARARAKARAARLREAMASHLGQPKGKKKTKAR